MTNVVIPNKVTTRMWLDRAGLRSNQVHSIAILYTVKLGYNELNGTGRICSLLPGYVITGLLFKAKISINFN